MKSIDRTLIYLTLYITECLRRLQKCQSHIQAQKELISAFPIPGDADFSLNGMFTKPTDDEGGKFSFRRS
jgi:actin related protein 2/3 complex subunit 3